jgi:hypothetical protein
MRQRQQVWVAANPGCVRSSAWISLFSSTDSTMAWAGGATRILCRRFGDGNAG